MRATVLAAGSGGDFAAAHGVPVKALVPVAGRPLVSYVVQAVQGAATIDETVVVCGPQARLPEVAVLGARQVQAAGEQFADTVRAATNGVGEGQLLLVSADLPMLTPEAVDATVNFALDSGADLTYTICDVDKVLAAYPGTKRTTVRLRDGRVTGANIAVARADVLLQSLARVDEAFGRRKSIVGLALLLGPMFLFRLLLGRLSVADAIARGEAILGCSVAVHASPYVEIGFDVDKPSDLEVAEALLGRAPTAAQT